MTGRIPSRKERRRRADEASEKLKDQFDKASDIYDDVREVVDTEDPSIEDYQLPEAIERMAAETVEIAEQRKALSSEMEAFDEESKRIETEMESITMELQDTQLTNEELEKSTKERLAWIKGFFEVDSKLAALVFEDKALFEDAIRDIRARGNRLQTKMHHVLDDVHSVTESLRSVKQEYDERLTDLVEPLQQELRDTKQQLEASKALGSSTDEELAKVKKELTDVKQEHQTSEMALQNEIEENTAEIQRLQTETETSLRQNTHLQTEIQRLESEKGVLSAQNAQQETTIKALHNATESMNGAAEELRNATETGLKAREALQKVLVRQNASRFNDKSAKRGPVLSSPEKPAPKRRQIRGGSAGAAEVLADVESNELLANTNQTFGSPSRRRRPVTPFTGHMTASRSGVSSPALNPTPATRQDLTVNPSPDTLVPPGQGVDPATNPSGLSVASEHVRDVWRQIEFPADWTAADSAILLGNFEEARRRKGGKYNRYWPQQAMDAGSQFNHAYCLTRDLRRAGKMAPGGRCESHTPNQLCIDVFYTNDNPGEYDSAATDKRWRLEKRE